MGVNEDGEEDMKEGKNRGNFYITTGIKLPYT